MIYITLYNAYILSIPFTKKVGDLFSDFHLYFTHTGHVKEQMSHSKPQSYGKREVYIIFAAKHHLQITECFRKTNQSIGLIQHFGFEIQYSDASL